MRLRISDGNNPVFKIVVGDGGYRTTGVMKIDGDQWIVTIGANEIHVLGTTKLHWTEALRRAIRKVTR